MSGAGLSTKGVGLDGAPLSTKGLVAEGTGSGPSPTPEPGTTPLPSPVPLPPISSVRRDGEVIIVIPTGINMVLAAAENIVENLRARRPASLTLPSLYKRAYMMAHVTDEIALVRERG